MPRDPVKKETPPPLQGALPILRELGCTYHPTTVTEAVLSSSLTSLAIANRRALPPGALSERLSPLLMRLSALQQLAFEKGALACYMLHDSRRRMEPAVPRLSPLTRLTALTLDDNCIGAAGAVVLAPQLQQLRALRSLELDRGDLGARGVAALVVALRQLTALSVLSLAGNGIGAAGAAALAPTLTAMQHLRLLFLSKNCIGAAGVAALAPALKALLSLRKLDLGGNGIGDGGSRALAAATSSLPSLKIFCYDNRLSTKVQLALVRCFPSFL